MPVRISLLALAAWLAGAALAHAAEPVALSTDAGIETFRKELVAYRGVGSVHWVVAARDHAQAEAAIARLALKLGAADQDLLTRVAAEAADPLKTPQAADAPIAFLEPALDAETPGCSWKVRVADPALPRLGAGAGEILLAPGDSAPVSARATFRLEHAGVLQARLYAFGETSPGAIRDLAATPEVNIPVASVDETIVLVTARKPSAVYEGMKAALASSAGERRDLGADQSLAGKNQLASRGIGAGIAAVPDEMVVAKPKQAAAASEPAESGPLETCRYRLVATRG